MFPVPRCPQAPAGDQAVTALREKIETLEAGLIEMEAIASGHRADLNRSASAPTR
jgi:hypothetical protein